MRKGEERATVPPDIAETTSEERTMEPTRTLTQESDHDHDPEPELLVRAWRAEQLERLGLHRILAEAYADLVDWHAFADLVERGCAPELALEIVL
jgi:hypothetical protein